MPLKAMQYAIWVADILFLPIFLLDKSKITSIINILWKLVKRLGFINHILHNKKIMFKGNDYMFSHLLKISLQYRQKAATTSRRESVSLLQAIYNPFYLILCDFSQMLSIKRLYRLRSFLPKIYLLTIFLAASGMLLRMGWTMERSSSRTYSQSSHRISVSCVPPALLLWLRFPLRCVRALVLRGLGCG